MSLFIFWPDSQTHLTVYYGHSNLLPFPTDSIPEFSGWTPDNFSYDVAVPATKVDKLKTTIIAFSSVLYSTRILYGAYTVYC
jgi:hypothetical protein